MIIDAVTYGKAAVRIQEAADCLRGGCGDLHQQFPRAHGLFLRAGSVMPTEAMQRLYVEFVECTQSVKEGNFSQMTDSELGRASAIIFDLDKHAMQFLKT